MNPLPQPAQSAAAQTSPAHPARPATPSGDPSADTVPFPSPAQQSAASLAEAGIVNSDLGPLPQSAICNQKSAIKRKLRSDSVFAKLSPEQHYKLRQWLREHSYSEVLTMVRRPLAEGGFGIDTHINSLCRYFQKQAGVDWLFMDMNLPNELLALADRSVHEASPFHPIASRFIERRLMFFASDPDSNIKSLTDLYKLVLKDKDRKFKEIQLAAKHPELAGKLQPHFGANIPPGGLQTPDDFESPAPERDCAESQSQQRPIPQNASAPQPSTAPSQSAQPSCSGEQTAEVQAPMAAAQSVELSEFLPSLPSLPSLSSLSSDTQSANPSSALTSILSATTSVTAESPAAADSPTATEVSGPEVDSQLKTPNSPLSPTPTKAPSSTLIHANPRSSTQFRGPGSQHTPPPNHSAICNLKSELQEGYDLALAALGPIPNSLKQELDRFFQSMKKAG